jgi:hypothetical protein
MAPVGREIQPQLMALSFVTTSISSSHDGQRGVHDDRGGECWINGRQGGTEFAAVRHLLFDTIALAVVEILGGARGATGRILPGGEPSLGIIGQQGAGRIVFVQVGSRLLPELRICHMHFNLKVSFTL